MTKLEHIETTRLVLRKPTALDAEAVYTRYSSDTEVTRYVGWPRHQSVDDTKAFLSFSDAEWSRWPAGPYLIEFHSGHNLLGSTGLAFEAPSSAVTGYVLARDAWGNGYATEALTAIVEKGWPPLFSGSHQATGDVMPKRNGQTFSGLTGRSSGLPKI